MNPGAAHAYLRHPTDPKLTGEVRFRVPDAYTTVAIGRRITELVNAGRPDELPRLNPGDLPYDAYLTARYVATLEHVIVTAPEGLFTRIDNQLVLTPGALTDFEVEEEDGSLRLLFAAYHEWRSSFRQSRSGAAAGLDAGQRGETGSDGGAEGRTEPAQGAGPA